MLAKIPNNYRDALQESYRVERAYDHEMNESGIASMGREIANIKEQLEALEEEKKEVMEDFKNKIQAAEKQLKKKCQSIRCGLEEKFGEVICVHFWEEEQKGYYDPDNYKLLFSAKIEAHEYQQEASFFSTELKLVKNSAQCQQ